VQRFPGGDGFGRWHRETWWFYRIKMVALYDIYDFIVRNDGLTMKSGG